MIRLGGTEKVVAGQAVNRMRCKPQGAGTRADDHLRVMVLPMRDPGNGVDEGHCLIVVFESIGLFQAIINNLPVIDVGQKMPNLMIGKG